MEKYSIENYIFDIDKYGLKKTWHTILSNTLDNNFDSDIFKIDNYGELYEIGLEHVNKISKKEMQEIIQERLVYIYHDLDITHLKMYQKS